MTILGSDMYTILIKRAGTRENGKASYRVEACIDVICGNWIVGWKLRIDCKYGYSGFAIRSAKPYKSGCFINPAKTLRESGLMR
jgi:hypothetical protein